MLGRERVHLLEVRRDDGRFMSKGVTLGPEDGDFAEKSAVRRETRNVGWQHCASLGAMR